MPKIGIMANALEIINPEHFETPNGGILMIGQCAGDEDHVIIIAHCDVSEADELGRMMITACKTMKAERDNPQ